MALLVPGAGAPLDVWADNFCQSLAEAGLYVVRYSHRDSGYSTHFDDPYPIEDLLQDLLALVVKVSSGAVHLVGHSMGGFLAQMAMCRRPDPVRSATSISAGSTVTLEQQAELGMSDVPEETWEVLMQNEPTGEFEQDLPGWLASWRFLNGGRPFDEVRPYSTRARFMKAPRGTQRWRSTTSTP